MQLGCGQQACHGSEFSSLPSAVGLLASVHAWFPTTRLWLLLDTPIRKRPLGGLG